MYVLGTAHEYATGGRLGDSEGRSSLPTALSLVVQHCSLLTARQVHGTLSWTALANQGKSLPSVRHAVAAIRGLRRPVHQSHVVRKRKLILCVSDDHAVRHFLRTSPLVSMLPSNTAKRHMSSWLRLSMKDGARNTVSTPVLLRRALFWWEQTWSAPANVTVHILHHHLPLRPRVETVTSCSYHFTT